MSHAYTSRRFWAKRIPRLPGGPVNNKPAKFLIQRYYLGISGAGVHVAPPRYRDRFRRGSQ
jgi:hypothetical protein